MGDRQLEHMFLTSRKMPGLAPCLLSFFFKSTFYLIDFSMKPVVAGAKVEGGKGQVTSGTKLCLVSPPCHWTPPRQGSN